VRSSKVAKRYARALLGLSNDSHQLESWGEEVERLARIIEMPEVDAAFASPEVALSAKIQALAIITEKADLSFPIRSFAAVVARHGRIQELPAVAVAYRSMLDDLMGRARATMTFAVEPGQRDVERIANRFEQVVHKKIVPTIRVDPTLIGGVVVELEGKTYDGSLLNQLREAQLRLGG